SLGAAMSDLPTGVGAEPLPGALAEKHRAALDAGPFGGEALAGAPGLSLALGLALQASTTAHGHLHAAVGAGVDAGRRWRSRRPAVAPCRRTVLEAVPAPPRPGVRSARGAAGVRRRLRRAVRVAPLARRGAGRLPAVHARRHRSTSIRTPGSPRSCAYSQRTSGLASSMRSQEATASLCP